MHRIAIDTGGTFTDLVYRDPNQVVHRLKVPSTPTDPGQGIHAAVAALIERLGHDVDYELRHGTTVATNAVLEARGHRVALITNTGFEDVLWLRRQDRPNLYALHPRVPSALIARDDVIGVRVRRAATGESLEPIENLNQWLETHRGRLDGADAFAVSLLHSYRDGRDERDIAAFLRTAYPDRPVFVSSDIAPVPNEYERTSTTTINAYVAPIMTDYLSKLTDSLPGLDSLSLMGSSGALMSLDDALKAPVRTVLSGPAGGVRGAWNVGLRCARSQLLTVDMGGTSTDVSVIDGDILPINEGTIGHHPVCVPLLPIETVGAGGGSIAFIDSGGELRVGPRSAGAVPGPACYGSPEAIEPTVTDANVVLGRIQNLLGGDFPLDTSAAERAVSRVATRLGWSLLETADAIIRIAEANMVRACKQVMIAQGAIPEQQTLVAFGGAAGLHACALADALGCRDVIFPADSGVLSAAGIHDAPHEVSQTRTLLLTDAAWGGSGRLDANSQLEAVGPLIRTDSAVLLADCRYEGQTWTLPVRLDPSWDGFQLKDAFEALHEARYGYRLEDNRAIEWVTLRVFQRTEHRHAGPEAKATDGRPRVGPQTISAYSATLYVPEGWTAQRLTTGDYLCTRQTRETPARHHDRAIFEVHRQRLISIAEEMGASLMQAAFSANIKERRDLSCAVFDRNGQLLCHAAHIPVHLGSTPLSVRAAIEEIDFKPGISAFLNDPYRGGTHLPDVTVVTPVFDDPNEAPIFYVANRAHHADVGGRLPGSLVPLRGVDGTINQVSIDDEGIRIPPTVLTDISREFFAQASRMPWERRGDLRAQEAANFVGAQRLSEWLATHDVELLERSNQALLDYSERRMRQVIEALPDGLYRVADLLDGDGSGSGPITLPLRMYISGDRVSLDFSEACDSLQGPLNAVRSIVLSAVFYCFRCLAGDDIPANEGLMRPIEVITRPGSFLDARPPAAVAAGNVETSQRLVDVIYAALAQAAPDRIPSASAGTMNNVLFGGLDTRQVPHRAFVHYETLAGGAGGGPEGHGADGIQVHMTNTLNTPVESIERLFPVEIIEYALAPAQRGSGQHRGGRGIIRAYRFLAPATVTLITERREIAPWGLHGASAGQVGHNQLVRTDGTTISLAGKQAIAVEAGEMIRIQTPGGGYWQPT